MNVGQLRRALRYLPDDAEVLVAIDGACVDAGFLPATHVSLIQVRRLMGPGENQAHFIKRVADGESPEGPQAAIIGDIRSAMRFHHGVDEAVEVHPPTEAHDDAAWSVTDLVPKAEE